MGLLLSHPDAEPEVRSPNRKALGAFLALRLLSALILLVLILIGSHFGDLGKLFPRLFLMTAISYLAFNSISVFLWLQDRTDFLQQVQFAVFTDIAAFTVLGYASGGINSGLNQALIMSMAAGSLLMDGRSSLSFAAIGSLATLAAQYHGFANQMFTIADFTQVGLFGAAIFAVALLGFYLSKRLRAVEQMAQQRGLDLADMAQLNSFIIGHLDSGILVIDSQDQVHFANERAVALLGLPTPATAQPLSTTCPQLARALNRGRQSDKATVVTLIPGPRAREIRLRMQPLQPEGPDCALLCFLEDHAELLQRAQQMKLASLGRLTASIAHEIRNPLAAISHAGQMLGECTELPPDELRLVEIIGNNVHRVNQMIEAVLQLSRRRQNRPEQIELAAWTRRQVEDYLQHHPLPDPADQLDLDLQPLQVEVDSGHLQQIFMNLLQNAWHHGRLPGKPLAIRISCHPSQDAAWSWLKITDQGPGVASEHLDCLFEPFFTTASTGTGLGLYIAKELSEINHLRLEYQPADGQGSSFCIGFPAHD